jgi:hypothetical protein
MELEARIPSQGDSRETYRSSWRAPSFQSLSSADLLKRREGETTGFPDSSCHVSRFPTLMPVPAVNSVSQGFSN